MTTIHFNIDMQTPEDIAFLMAAKMIDDTNEWNYEDRLRLYRDQSDYLQDEVSQAVVMVYHVCEADITRYGWVRAAMADMLRIRTEHAPYFDCLEDMWAAQ